MPNVKRPKREGWKDARWELAMEAITQAKYLCEDDKTSVVIFMESIHQTLPHNPNGVQVKDCEHCERMLGGYRQDFLDMRNPCQKGECNHLIKRRLAGGSYQRETSTPNTPKYKAGDYLWLHNGVVRITGVLFSENRGNVYGVNYVSQTGDDGGYSGSWEEADFSELPNAKAKTLAKLHEAKLTLNELKHTKVKAEQDIEVWSKVLEVV